MDIESLREYCLSKSGVSEGFPFDSNTLVFKVMGKIFVLTNLDLFQSLNLKCDPEYAIELRETFQGVKPGYHMNKKHWNTVSTKSDVPDKLIQELVDHSYDRVVKSLTKRLRDGL
ncbi:MAG: MmcQ-like protein [Fluviicola sp.]|nr:MAG: MmcQ-like protein [Fluviicola sp.]